MLQTQARALGDPTRHEIFRYIADADCAVDVAELTAHLGLNHNAIRQHLAKLVAAELVAEDQGPRAGPGRPRLLYRLHPAAESRWGVTGPYERLSLLLTDVVRTGDAPVDVGRRSVRRRRLGASDDEDPASLLVETMEREGFEPELRVHGTSIELVLGNCPFVTTALVDPDIVCSLHLGMAQGIADLTAGRLVVDELVPRDPRRAMCRLLCHVEPDRDDRSQPG